MREPDSVRFPLAVPLTARLTPCGFDEARRLRANGVGFVSCASSPCSPCWCCSRGWRSHSVWFAPSRARSLFSTLRRSDAQVDGVIYRLQRPLACWRCSAVTRAACCSRTSATSRRSCARRSSRSRTSASTSTTASTRAASRERSGRTFARRVSSRAARRSPSSSSRTRTSERAHDRAQGPRGGARMAARAALVEGPDPARVPEHDLLRQRRLRDPAGGPDVLRQGRRSLTLAESALLAGLPADPSLYDPPSIRALRSSGAATCCRRCTTRARSPRASCERIGAPPLPKARRRAAAGHAGAGAVLRQLRQGPAVAKYGAGRVFGGGLKVTTTIDLGLQETGASRRSRASSRLRTARPRRSWRSTRATGAVRAMVGGIELPQEPVQPRHAGRAPARLVVQADRARDGAAAGHLAGDARSTPSRSTSMQATASGTSRTTRAPTSGASTWPRDGLLGQLGVRPADQARRPRRRSSQTAHALGIRSELDSVLLDRARRGRGQPARHDARLRDVRQRRRARRRLADRGSSRESSSSVEFARTRAHERERARSREPAMTHGRGRPAHLDPRRT